MALERENRAYCAGFISDRGDEFFDQFAERYAALLAEQEAGRGVFYVLADENGSVLGRFDLYDVKAGSAVSRFPSLLYPASKWGQMWPSRWSHFRLT